MPVAFLAGGFDTNPWQAAYSALGRPRLGLLQLLLQSPALRRAIILPTAYMLLQLLVRGVLVPALRHPEAPVSAVLGRGLCGGFPAAAQGVAAAGVQSSSVVAHLQYLERSVGAAGHGPGSGGLWPLQLERGHGGLLWGVITWVLRALWVLAAWVLGRVRSGLKGKLCQSLAMLCGDPAVLTPADCAALFDGS